MIQSMTGYGRAVETIGAREIAVDIKCVNHRYYEPTFRITRSYAYLEEKLKRSLAGRIERGKLEVTVSITDRGGGTTIACNAGTAEAYHQALTALAQQLGADYRPDVYAIARMPEVFTLEQAEADENEVFAEVQTVLEAALSRFFAMRRAEGEKMAEDIENRLCAIEQCVAEVEQCAGTIYRKYFDRLSKKMQAVLESVSIDEARIVQEAAIFADKVAVDEETVRLRSHIAQMRTFLQASEPIGKKMDFLAQEFNREANTIGSKAGDVEITRTVVELKAQIEKIREQVQNVE